MRLLFVLVVALASAKFFKVVSTEEKSTWVLRERADGFVSFRVNFAYRNQDRLDQIFNEVSDVSHANYGKYLTTVELNKLVNPSLKEKQPVYDWLSQHSCTFADVGQHAKVRCPVRRVEALLQTRLYNWVNSKNKRRDVKALQGFQVPDRYLDVLCDKHPIGGSMTVMEPPRKLGFVIDHSRLNAQGGPVTVAVVPQTLEAQYAINGLTINPPYNVVTQCVAEFGNDNSYLPSDLTAFSVGMNVNIEGTVAQHGPFNPSPPDPESTLDIQYIASTGRNGSNVFWVVSGWLHEWLGDIQAAGSPPEISSISWGSDERQQGASYSTGVDLQFKALNTVGCTFLAASGDTGAIGQPSCRNQYVFNPGYPATSPYVLSVGATMFDSFVNGNINTPFCQGNFGLGNCAVSGHEQPADVSQYSFSSGGGFSTYATQPAWQKDVVTRYTESHKIKLPPTKDFTKSNRGFPDVAAQGWNIIIQLGGQWSGIGGTSASSPIFAGMISLMNDHQRKRGKAKLGFINPIIYQMANATAGIFTTIGDTSTNNKNGCKYGFVGSANVAGVPWNPVTGLGVINLQKALAWLDANTH